MGSRRLCFVASDLLGLVTNSGIGTATSYGAIVLASAGHEVTLVHTRAGCPIEPHWQERYRAAGIEVEEVAGEVVAPGHFSAPYRVFRHLAGRDFDAIVFQDWLALGWACMEAKHAGLAFGRSQLVHIAHGPEAWLHEANLQVAIEPEDLAVAHAGRRSAELADTVMGPSNYLLDWMAAAGWSLPGRRFVVPYFTERNAREAIGEPPLPAPPAAEAVPVRELAFFGRLERRKGVQVFAAAVNRLEPELLRGLTISFLGREATFRTHEVLAMFDPRVRRTVESIRFHTDLDNEQACQHLGTPGTLAVVASLTDNSPNTIYECIERRIPFLATATGGTPELLAAEDRARCLVGADPASMAEGLRRTLGVGQAPEAARPSFDASASLRSWDDLLAWEPPPVVTVRESPLVTAVLTHHDRPALVGIAVEALDAQDYANVEIVVVDDGSTRAESHRVLDGIEAREWRHPLRVVRQPNRYLGAARNAGAAAGRGDLLVFADDDDVPMPAFVSTLVTAAQASGADAVTCAMTSFHEPLGAPKESDSRGTWVFAGGPLYLAAVQNCLGGAAALVRRGALEAVGGYHERHGLGLEDWHLYVRLLVAGYSVVAVPEPLYWYRVQPGSMRHTMSNYHSVGLVLDEYRKLVPPELHPLLALVHGQGVAAGRRLEDMSDEIGLRERALWLAEERAERLLRTPPPTGPAVRDSEPEPFTALVAEVVRRGVAGGKRRARQAADRVDRRSGRRLAR
ncbi:MAG TPA: glycosyltransferase [Acidimicrobiales bacterium]|nr:glycosyltransferase [Acidimicrobiales bacterium]